MNLLFFAGYATVLCFTAFLFVYFYIKDNLSNGKHDKWDDSLPDRDKAQESLQQMVYIMYIFVWVLISGCWGRMVHKRKEQAEFANMLMIQQGTL